MFSARGAGILGFSMFGSKRIYALDDDMKLDVNAVKEFLETYKNQKILLFDEICCIMVCFFFLPIEDCCIQCKMVIL